MFIDTHCHISEEDYNVESLMKELGSNYVIASGASKKDNLDVLKLIEKYPNAYGTIGYHPDEASSLTEDDFVLLEQQLKHKKIVGIGEIGLDYYHTKENKEIQKQVFIRQIELAKKYHLPIVIHSRDSISDTYEIVKKYCNSMKVVMHCYSGSLESAYQFTKLGVKLGIGGVLTFKNAKNLVEVVSNIDLSYLLTETDSPYLTPVPYRGKQNKPTYIPLIIEKIAEIKGLSVEDVQKQTFKNAVAQFDLDIKI